MLLPDLEEIRRWLAWYIPIALCVVFNVAIPATSLFVPFPQGQRALNAETSSIFIYGILCGLILAEIAVLGAWVAFANWAVGFRILAGCLLAVILSFAFLFGVATTGRRLPWDGVAFVTLMGPAMVLCTALLLRIARNRTRLLPKEVNTKTKLNSQFHLRFLLLIMVGIAVSFELLRRTARFTTEISILNGTYQILLGCCAIACVACAAVAILSLTATLDERRARTRALILIAITGVYGSPLFQWICASILMTTDAGNAFLSSRFAQSTIFGGYCAYLGMVAGTYAGFLWFRFLGYRLKQRSTTTDGTYRIPEGQMTLLS
jgi:hypothetical protein